MSEDRPTRADVPFVAIALASGVVLLYLGRSLSFFNDEWRSISFDGGPIDYLRPVNEHWSTFPLLLYRGTLGIVGLHSYLPYLAEVIALHLLAVAGAYALMRRRVGPFVATLMALPLLLLGIGAENLFWAYQTGFVGSVMFGVWALFFIERPSRRAAPIASLLLVASLASSGMGLFFLIAAAGRTTFDSSLRRRILAVASPAATYLLWFAVVGSDAVGVSGRVVGASEAARFALVGIIYSTERSIGFDHLPGGHLWGLVVFLGLSVLTAAWVARGHPPALAVGCLLGMTAMYTVIAVARAGVNLPQALASRYVYVAAFLLTLVAADLLSRRRPWSVGSTRRRVAVTATLLLVLGCSIVANVVALSNERATLQLKTDVTRAFIELALTRGNEPWVDRRATLWSWTPPVPQLVRTVERYGSPLEDGLFPRAVKAPSKVAEEAALVAMIGDGFRVEPPRASGVPVRLGVVASDGLALSANGTCVRANVIDNPATLSVAATAGTRIRVSSSSRMDWSVELGHDLATARLIELFLEPGTARDVLVPDVGDRRRWQIEIHLPSDARRELLLCASRMDEAAN